MSWVQFSLIYLLGVGGALIGFGIFIFITGARHEGLGLLFAGHFVSTIILFALLVIGWSEGARR